LKPDYPAHVTGDRGEEAVARVAVERGWKVIARRLRTARGEADIVGSRRRGDERHGLLVEVKASKRVGADLARRIDPKKRARLWRIAEELVATHDFAEIRVVAALVHLGPDREHVTWLELEPF